MILTVLGAALVVVGLAAVYWPLALIVAGGALGYFGLASDDGEDS
jgi:hypothetical protein